MILDTPKPASANVLVSQLSVMATVAHGANTTIGKSKDESVVAKRSSRSSLSTIFRHCQLVGLRVRWRAIGTACSWLRQSGDAGDISPNLKGLGPVGSILGSWNLMAAEVEEVADPVVGGQEALCLAG
jgi:hypothetical protein